MKEHSFTFICPDIAKNFAMLMDEENREYICKTHGNEIHFFFSYDTPSELVDIAILAERSRYIKPVDPLLKIEMQHLKLERLLMYRENAKYWLAKGENEAENIKKVADYDHQLKELGYDPDMFNENQ